MKESFKNKILARKKIVLPKLQSKLKGGNENAKINEAADVIAEKLMTSVRKNFC